MRVLLFLCFSYFLRPRLFARLLALLLCSYVRVCACYKHKNSMGKSHSLPHSYSTLFFSLFSLSYCPNRPCVHKQLVFMCVCVCVCVCVSGTHHKKNMLQPSLRFLYLHFPPQYSHSLSLATHSHHSLTLSPTPALSLSPSLSLSLCVCVYTIRQL